MTLVYRDYNHVHISEREIAHRLPDGRWDDGVWEDCLWCSAVEVYRFGGLDIPATHAEAEALRAASGEPPTGGSNHNDLVAAVWSRYGVTAISGQGFSSLWSDLVPGTAAVVSGSLGVFLYGHTLRRHLPKYTGGHAVAVFRVGPEYRVWWCDPLAPDGYVGQWVSDDQLRQFMGGWDGRYTFVRFNQFKENTMEAKPVFEETRLVPITLGTWLYFGSDLANDARNIQLTGRTPEQLLLRHVLTYKAADATGKGGIYMVAYEPLTPDLNSSSIGMFVRSEDVSGPFVRPVAPPDTTPFDQAYVNDQLANATAPLQAVIDEKTGVVESQAAIIASQKTEIAAAALQVTEATTMAASFAAEAEAAKMDAAVAREALSKWETLKARWNELFA